MRIKRNSSSADLSVIRDKALDLGYTWDVTKYPTPAWDIDVTRLRYSRPLFDIPVDIWNRELRLWSCDCAERVVHRYEEWARVNLPDQVNTCRELIQASRDYANGLISKEELGRVRQINAAYYAAYSAAYYATYYAAYPAADAAADAAYYAAYSAAYHAADAAAYAADAAYYAAYYARSSEKLWQRGALAQRLDKVAPWRLN